MESEDCRVRRTCWFLQVPWSHVTLYDERTQARGLAYIKQRSSAGTSRPVAVQWHAAASVARWRSNVGQVVDSCQLTLWRARCRCLRLRRHLRLRAVHCRLRRYSLRRQTSSSPQVASQRRNWWRPRCAATGQLLGQYWPAARRSRSYTAAPTTTTAAAAADATAIRLVVIVGIACCPSAIACSSLSVSGRGIGRESWSLACRRAVDATTQTISERHRVSACVTHWRRHHPHTGHCHSYMYFTSVITSSAIDWVLLSIARNILQRISEFWFCSFRWKNVRMLDGLDDRVIYARILS